MVKKWDIDADRGDIANQKRPTKQAANRQTFLLSWSRHAMSKHLKYENRNVRFAAVSSKPNHRPWIGGLAIHWLRSGPRLCGLFDGGASWKPQRNGAHNLRLRKKMLERQILELT